MCNQWIKCSERMADHDDPVWFYNARLDCVYCGPWNSKMNAWLDADVEWHPASDVTHWMAVAGRPERPNPALRATPTEFEKAMMASGRDAEKAADYGYELWITLEVGPK
jgi:hypothetical protein